MEILIAGRDDAERIRDLFWEYLVWANDRNDEAFGLRLDIEGFLAEDMAGLDKFMPPDGRLVLAVDGGEVMGCVCLKRLKGDIGEIKRMYVRPAYRRQGVGRALVERALTEAEIIGYPVLRLDSTRYMTGAHALYRSVGFRDRAPYPESEVPAEYHQYWVFMERDGEE